MKCAMYEITHIQQGITYVGISNNPKYRWRQHRCTSDLSKFHIALRQFGKLAFNWTVVAWFDTVDEALAAETSRIKFLLRTPNRTYNTRSIGSRPPPETIARISQALKGHPVSAITRAKMSASAKKRKRGPCSAETRAKIGAANSIALKGKTKSPETIAKLSASLRKAMLGHVVSDATKNKLRQANLGKRASQETREKLSLIHTGRKMPREAVERGALKRKGLKRTEESKVKMRAAQAKWKSQPGRREKFKPYIYSDATKAKMRASRLAYLTKTNTLNPTASVA